MKILVDAFGGDHSPEAVIGGAVDAVNERGGFTAVLVGKPDVIENSLKNYTFDASRVEILPASEVVTCEEEPAAAMRKKPDSSINVAFKELKQNDEAVAFVSAGSTGAVLVGATLKLGRLPGVNRPALCPVLPTLKEGKNVFLLDSGANADCKSVNIVQFAVMGSAYAEVLGVKNPAVALLSNGTEDEKGNALNHEAFPLLKAANGVNFIGNVEGREILSGDFDVLVTDGFAGNVALKSIEGAVGVLFALLKGEIYSSFRSKIGGALLKPGFKNLKDKLDYNDKGGALFLGVNKIVIKAHGSSKRTGIKNTVLQAVTFAESGLIDRIKQKLSENDLEQGK